MGVKRFDYILGTGPEEGWMEEAALGQYIKSADYDALAAEMAPCNHEKAFRKTITTNEGIVFVCETCSHHWYRTYAQINSASETSAQRPGGENG